MEKSVQITLFLSSYIPLFIIIIIQNIFSLFENLKVKFDFQITNPTLIFQNLKIIHLYFEFYLILILSLLIITLLILVKRLISSLDDNDVSSVTVQEIININHSTVTNYFAVYIFPFITLDLTSLLGVIQFVFLGSIIGYIYIKNDLIYVNPVLNILFKLNIYEIEFSYSDSNVEVNQTGILLSKRDKQNLAIGNQIDIIVKNPDLYFNIK
ncbi:hypothetical protein ACIP9G_13200 [Lysinibacillus sp. NPDC093197]|uniref:hypothetical protein n=1 Tax=Lysinibacillus sp. NPDC093197 TaxID=3364132 RepID=UPI0037F92A4E